MHAPAREAMLQRIASEALATVGYTGREGFSAPLMAALSRVPRHRFVPASQAAHAYIGGPRNWAYRICWLRDATATLLAFMHLGYFEEAAAWREWLMRTAAGDPGQMQIMYGVAGERRLPEWEVPWFSGFMGSLPVRVGNVASEQFQVDIYGEVADAMTQARKGGLPLHPRTRRLET